MRININMTNEIDSYIDQVGYREHPSLLACRMEASKRGEYAVMQVSPEQGAFLSMLVKLTGASKILEVGTFTGYSSLAMALAFDNKGLIVTCDNSKEYTDIAKKFWDEAGISDHLDLRIGEASKTLQDLIDNGHSESFDLILIDADKDNYPDYFEKSLKLAKKGALIILDDTLIYGRVATGLQDSDSEYVVSAVTAMQELNIKLHKDERIDMVMIPWRDGVTLARKKT